MAIKKLLISAVIISTASVIPVMAEEIDVPAIINSQPEKSLNENIKVPDPIPTNEVQKINSRPVIFNSLLFNKNISEQMENAHNEYSAILATRELDDSGGNIRENQQQQNQAAPQLPQPVRLIYLSSIIYENAKIVAVWINNEKYRVGDTIKDITVVAARPDKVDLLYDLSNYSFDFSDSRVTRNPNIKVDKEKKQLSFSMVPNHRLDLNTMDFYAGKSYQSQMAPGETPIGQFKPAPMPQQQRRGPGQGQLQPGMRPEVMLPAPLGPNGQPMNQGQRPGQQMNPGQMGGMNQGQRPGQQMNPGQMGGMNQGQRPGQQMNPGQRPGQQMNPGQINQGQRPGQPMNQMNQMNQGQRPGQQINSGRVPIPTQAQGTGMQMQVSGAIDQRMNANPSIAAQQVGTTATIQYPGGHPVAKILNSKLPAQSADPQMSQIIGYSKYFNESKDPVIMTLVKALKQAKTDEDVELIASKFEGLQKQKEAEALKTFSELSKKVKPPTPNAAAAGGRPGQQPKQQ